MSEASEALWYNNAVIYALDVETFQDSDGDGVGDFRGLIDRIPYLVELGVTCIWLLPFYPTPNRDNGYDIAGYLSVDPRLGTLEDFNEFVRRAGEHGIRVIVDLVTNHTSDQHPWFQASRSDAQSRFRDYYVWSESPPPPDPGEGTIFPDQESSVWTYDEVAGAYYFHRFYSFEPELNISNPEVRQEIFRILDFWLCFGVSGFRVDAASHMIEAKGLESSKPDDPHGVLKDVRSFIEERKKGAVLIGESDVKAARIQDYFGDGDELNLLFNFLLDNYLFLAFARQQAAPLEYGVGLLPSIPHKGQWANFLRNLDELDLERISDEEREEVYAAFAPDQDMRIFGRGIRRRLAPMLSGNRARIEMAFSLLFSLPGTPVLVYGDELGMGENLELEGREAVRTPMQWTAGANGGFSSAPAERLVLPMVRDERFAPEKLNVSEQTRDPDSLLCWTRRLIEARRKSPEFGWGACHVVANEEPAIFAHRAEWRGGHMLAIHNLAGEERSVSLNLAHQRHGDFEVAFGGGDFELREDDYLHLTLPAWGYIWLREGPHGSEDGGVPRNPFGKQEHD